MSVLEKKTKSIPKSALRFKETELPVGITELKEPDKKDKRRFSMLAHSGKVMENHWFWGNFAIDLKGISVGRKKKPALRDHSSNRIVGWTEDIFIDDKRGVMADGIFSEKTIDGKEVLSLADEGFPWQASVYIPPLSIETIREGEEREVNGHKLKGPGTIFRKSVLREVSFCALGADENTHASAFSDKSETIDLDVEEIKDKEEVSGMELKDLTVEVLKKERNDLVDALTKENLEEGARLEKKRILGVLKEAKAFTGMDDLANELVENGASIEEAVAQFKDARLKELEKSAPKTSGPGDDPEEGSDANLSFEEKLEREWEKEASLREEFSSKEAFIAFRKAEERGAVKILKK